MRKPLWSITGMALVWLAASLPARAHFVWIIPSQHEPGKFEIVFSEGAYRGSSELVSRLQGVNAEFKTADGSSRNLALSPVTSEDEGAMLTESTLPSGDFAIEAKLDYGVFGKTGAPVRLIYYTKHLRSGCSEKCAKLAGETDHSLEVVPCSADPRSFQVLWHGEPATGASVTVTDQQDNEDEFETSDKGLIEVPTDWEGPFAVRAMYRDTSDSGTLAGQDYQGALHIATLTMSVPEQQHSASDVLIAAREHRALWEDFSGFTASMTLTVNDDQFSGKVIVAEDGEVSFDVSDGAPQAWLERTVSSLVMHRLPGNEVGSGGEFLRQVTPHPLGQEIELHGEGMGSIYRVNQDVVREVNREMGSGHFKISVLDIFTNAEGKYLPKVYVVTFWNDESGSISNTSTVMHEWQRVGKWDLPRTLTEVTSRPNGSEIRKIEFENLELVR